MSAPDVEAEILAPMQRMFLPPRGMDETQQVEVLREYARALESFEAVDLRSAWESVRDAHETRGWPVIGQFVLAARLARKARVGDTPRHAAREGDSAAARWIRWVEIRNSQLAREAVDRNVAWALKCAVLNDGKKAGEISVQELFIAKRNAENTRDLIAAGEPVPNNGRQTTFDDANRVVALQMFDTLIRREAETQAEIRQHLPPERINEAEERLRF